MKKKVWIGKNVMERSVMGFAIGDALGVPYEFQTRGSFQCKEMVACNEISVHQELLGTWSDDTSLLLCVMDALCESSKEGMFQKWSENAIGWMYDGMFSCTDMPFDIGRACRLGILELKTGKKNWFADETDANGNGGLMRVLPLAFLDYANDEELMEMIRLFNSCSHNHMISHVGCLIYIKLVKALLSSMSENVSVKEWFDQAMGKVVSGISAAYKLPEYGRIWNLSVLGCSEAEIKSSGYVVDTLEAAIWCNYHSNSYQQAVLKAVNLGDDTDTVAALTGGIAGVLYEDLLAEWVKGLRRKDFLESGVQAFENKLQNSIAQNAMR